MPQSLSTRFVLALAGSSMLIPACAPLQQRVATASAQLPLAPLPLGAPGLAETRSVETLSPGLDHHHIYRGQRGNAFWLISTPTLRTAGERASGRACLEQAGLVPEATIFSAPGSNPTPYTIYRGGSFRTEAAARAAIPPTLDPGCRLGPQHSSGDPAAKHGPWSVHILVIDPRLYRGRLVSALARDTAAGVERTSDIARRRGARAAINGGFFVTKDEDGVVGEPAGIAVIEGRVRSEPTLERPYLLLRDGARVAAEIVREPRTAALQVRWSDGSRSAIDGVDRRPGVIRNCGLAGSRPSERPMHDVTCWNPNELVVLTEEAGFTLDAAAGDALLVHSSGKTVPAIASARPGPGQRLLIATGTRRVELTGKARAHIDLSYRALEQRIDDESHRRTYAVNGGPLLIRGGVAVRQEDREGWRIDGATDAARATFVHNWVVRRNPRSAVGVTANGRIYFVTVDGREFEGEGQEGSPASIGLAIDELRGLMQWLGARDAINLDGGGSTALVIRGRVVNRPSDKSGERPIGDAILVIPAAGPQK